MIDFQISDKEKQRNKVFPFMMRIIMCVKTVQKHLRKVAAQSASAAHAVANRHQFIAIRTG